ncbi:M23 family metallopeptidase [candidate division WOR-3 bacterium]|nr:M23 family metallopeptidase [candidate division WOR-3 bacterium]
MKRFLTLALSAALFSCTDSKRVEIPLMEDSSAFRDAAVSETVVAVLDSGEYLSSLISRSSPPYINSGEVSLVFNSLFRTDLCRPGETLFVYIDNDTVTDMLFKRREDQIYRVFKTESGWKGETVEVAVTYVPLLIRGKIDQESPSLWQGIIKAGGNDDLAATFCNLLQYQADFTFSSRVGDSFEILVFKKYLDGELIGRTPIFSGIYWGSKTFGDAYLYSHSRFSHFSRDGQSSERKFLSSPVSYTRISSHFSPARFHPILHYTRAHRGVDYSAPTGTPVSAVSGGTVSLSGWAGEAGIAVRIQHSGGIESEYYHLSRIADGVVKGKRVEQGQVIGFVGSTGLSTGPHLHFGIKINGTHVDPLPVLERASGEELPQSEKILFHKALRYYSLIGEITEDLSFIEIETSVNPSP